MIKKKKIGDFIQEDSKEGRVIRDAFSYNVIAKFKGFDSKKER